MDAHRNFASPLGTDGLSLRQQYLEAMLSCQYPQGEVGALAGGRAGGGGARAALLEWQAALGSLYESVRCGRCDAAFCEVSPQVGAGGDAEARPGRPALCSVLGGGLW